MKRLEGFTTPTYLADNRKLKDLLSWEYRHPHWPAWPLSPISMKLQVPDMKMIDHVYLQFRTQRNVRRLRGAVIYGPFVDDEAGLCVMAAFSRNKILDCMLPEGEE